MSLILLEKIVAAYLALIPRHKPPIQAFKLAQLIAHRGAHNSAQGIIENTHAAFDLAQDLGCWGIEFDVRTTADNVMVVNHDATLKRIWGHDREIAQLRFNELRALAPNIPTLNEVVTAYGQRMHLFIELKTAVKDERILVQTLQELSPGEHYHLLTLDPLIFDSLSQIPKNVLLLVAGLNVSKLYTLCLKANYGGVLGHYSLLTNKIIHRLVAAKKMVGVGMVDSKYSLYRELSRGIQWIFTNRAAEMAALGVLSQGPS